MRKLLEKLDRVDRRVIYVLMALSVFVPLVFRLDFPIPVGGGPSRDLFEYVDSLPPGSTVLISYDYDPSTMPELQPMAVALTQHLFTNGHRIIATALWPQGASLSQEVLSSVGDSLGRTQYSDWVNLGYTVGAGVSVLRMGSSMQAVYPQDRDGVPYDSIPMLRRVTVIRDLDMIVCLSAGDPGIHAWVMMAGDRYGVPVGGGCTAVSAPEFFPYLGTGQMIGLLGGLKGAADYETLVREGAVGCPPGTATPGMAAQSIAHLVIMGFIVLGNITYLSVGKGRKGASR
ncbi:MAG: hypothetical protein IT351_03005 [Candidatus Fermentibacter sp.]|nr:hypothetical protein [Candidatus Fermentibacter sp.]